jgi:HEAT repeat protein
MIRRRSLCTFALAAAFLATPARAQTDENFQAAVEALSRGADEEALGLLRQVLAEDPSHEHAYELFQQAEHTVWLKLLTKGGDFEVLAKELMARASMGRKQRQNNPDAIRELVKELSNDDIIQRRRVINQLASDFGEYSVPILVYSLTQEADETRRLNVMNALLNMGSDVVPPLIETLDAPDAYLRRNVALTLGRI